MLLLSVILLLCLSAFFSGTETAVMALDRYQVRTLSEEGDTHAYKLMQYLKDPERFFAVVLLGNTFANIAAASILTQVAQGMSPDAFIVIMDEYSKMIKGEPHKDIPKKLLTFSGVSKYPMRVKCATMAWHALKAAIKKAQVPLILSDAVADYWRSLLDNMGQTGL